MARRMHLRSSAGLGRWVREQWAVPLARQREQELWVEGKVSSVALIVLVGHLVADS